MACSNNKNKNNHMKKILILLSLVSLQFVVSYAQELTPQEVNDIYEKHRNMSDSDKKTYLKKYHPRVPSDIVEKIAAQRKNGYIKNSTLDNQKDESNRTLEARSSKLPTDASFPGEWEEMQGVFISWPYTWPGNLIDTVRATPFADIWKMICHGVQLGNAKIYINVRAAKDSNAIKKYMVDKGYPLTNYRFLINPGDDIWARDFAQIPYYYDTDDKIGWVDFKYYPGRNNDNLLPQKWATQLGGITVKTSKLNWEGGNIIMDGMSNEIIGSDMVNELNLAVNNYNATKVRDSIREYLNTTNSKIKLVPTLLQEGGTGHIDLYAQRADEATIVYATMPTEMERIPRNSSPDTIWDDYRIAKGNLDSFKSYITDFAGKSDYIFQTTLPKNDNNQWYQSGAEYEQFTRTYSNSLIVNNVIVQPIFFDDVDGNKVWDLAAMEKVKNAFPGYEIIPVDMRLFDGTGGSIHCVTKEHPAINPIRMFHYPYRDSFLYQSKFPISAILKNQSGIEKAFVYYRKKGATTWIKLPLTEDVGNLFLANIPGSNIGGETIEYYIEATSFNGKTMTKPMPAPKGFYTFKNRTNPKPVFNASVSNQIAEIENIYPIPTSRNLFLNISNPSSKPVDILVYSMDGKMVYSKSESKSFNNISLDLSSVQAGIYIVELFVDGKSNGYRRIVKN